MLLGDCIDFPTPFMQAGLAGYSDRAMRLVARRRGCPYAVTEAILDRVLLGGGKGLTNSIDVNDEDHPVAGQVMGSEPDEVAAAGAILADHGYDVVDLNFACPVKKVKNKARGGWMLKDDGVGVDVLRATRDRLPDHPLSVSLRRGFDDSAEAEDRFWRLCEAAHDLGYVAVRVHGRTVEQKYAGRSRRPFLKDVKQRFPDWFVWGSGDVFTAEDAADMLNETGVDGVWIARGAIGNPWIFRDAERLRQEKPISPPTIDEQRDALLEHFDEAVAIHGESLAGRRMRKIGIKYARFHPRRDEVKQAFIGVRSLADWRGVVGDFYSAGGEGVWPERDAVDEVNDGGCS
ncbi:MAG: tRNA-dihydrouridine synthase family protein [Planctomycetota bacterium]